ncbi:MAG: phosphonopyruvate decarboxylase [Rhodospirillaceae bacterium]|jgi:sulfopyruvate decarboxylase alpha subunit|nr:phosphonopyruvate decarboxylase [Rhodospirillaceae bacterium]|tara:strand:- start:740 stop:1285 length:546 start_codon:yes stop_codon:yes gene_type:complete
MSQSGNNGWSNQLFGDLIDAGVTLFTYVPDAGNAKLIELANSHNEAQTVLLTSEEEGVAVCAGADLVGKRGILCMQSSGVGNCPNFLSLVKGGGFPILMMVSMRGDYGEQNPWQHPMGQAVEPILHALGVLTFRVEAADGLKPATEAALAAAFGGGHGAALILSQKFLGAKPFPKAAPEAQ